MHLKHLLPAAGLLLGLAAVAVAQVATGLPAVTGYKVIVETDAITGVRPGQTVAITGSGFGSQVGNVQVSCIDAAVTSWSDSRVTFTVPNTAPTTVPVTVTLFTSHQTYYTGLAFRILAP